MQMPDGTFANPVAAEVAAGHGGFAPPMLVYAIAREGERAATPRSPPPRSRRGSVVIPRGPAPST